MGNGPGRSPASLERRIGIVGLTFVAVGGMVGSGWLFAPLLAAKVAGPASIVSWLIGGVMILLIAMTFAETSAMFPVVGGLARVPQFSHGSVIGIFVGWTAWVGYVTQAPIEVQALLEYASNDDTFAWLFNESAAKGAGTSLLSLAGVAVAGVLLAALTVVNLLGVRFFSRVNTQMTWFKLAVPAVFAAVVLATSFEPGNLTDHGGFAPNGITGVLAAISTGGIAFAFIGFRHALDLAGEAERPQSTVPAALIISVALCIGLFVAVQLAFVGSLPTEALTGGWERIDLGQTNGPVAELATVLGLTWVARLVLVDAMVSPIGAGLVSTASTSRLAVAVSRNGLFPRFFQALSGRGVPMNALFGNLAVGTLIFWLRDGWQEIVAFNTGAIVLSFFMGPITVYTLRRRIPDRPRPFRVPGVRWVAAAGFVVVGFIIYWTGWDTLWRLSLPIGLGVVVFVIRIVRNPAERRSLDWKPAWWLPLYLGGLLLVSFAGNFDGGRGYLSRWLDLAVLAAFSLGIFAIAVRSGLAPDAVQAYISQEETDAGEDLEKVG